MTESASRGLERLELRIERLKATFRFTFAFHAREVRFECDRGEGFERVFPEVFSFQGDERDPAELYLQLDDLFTKPQLIAPKAHPRDAAELVSRLVSHVPRYLERVCDARDAEARLDVGMRTRMYQDIGVLAQVLARFQQTRELEERRSVRVASFLLNKLMFRSMSVLLENRVDPEYLAGYVRGDEDPIDPSDDVSESGFHHALESGSADAVNRMVVRMAERSFYLWLEGVCLDTDNQAFEKEDSPFESREVEILKTICVDGKQSLERGQDLRPYLRRASRDCLRVLERLETWFLRQYDIAHSSACIHHRAALERGGSSGGDVLTFHSPRNYLLAIGTLAAPFIGGAFAYRSAPVLFDFICSAEVVCVNAAAIWFLVYKFVWKRDLTVFHASVPRIGAGIIVGFLPVFLIDEVWGLASREAYTLFFVASFLGLATLLYIYVEIQRRLGDSHVAFARARNLFLLGIVEASALGVVMTSLVGRYMVGRNWSPSFEIVPLETMRLDLEPLIGQLPRIVGFEPFYAFPSAVVMVTFLSFFIGIFLQLMWEELPITEPL